MKKIINSILFSFLLLISCSKKEEEKVTPAIVVNEIVGIGKVLPKDGIITLSVSSSSKVVKIYKQVGDTLTKGDVLFEMESITDQILLNQAKAEVQTASATASAKALDVTLAKTKLVELKTEFETSKNLLKYQAETPEKVLRDSIAYIQQLKTIQQLEKQNIVQQSGIQEKKAKVNLQNQAVQDKRYIALQGGTLLRFDVAVGQILNSNVTFGEIAPKSALVIEAELDELYAHKIKKGQKVEVALVGQTEILAQGIISNVGASLQNKSIIYEQVGESQDRRVRRFTVILTKGEENMLINQKVECKIKL